MTLLGALDLEAWGARARREQYEQLKRNEAHLLLGRRLNAEIERDQAFRRAIEFCRATAATELRHRRTISTEFMPYANFERVAEIHPNALQCIGRGYARYPTNTNLAAEVFCRLETLMQWLDIARARST